MRLPDRMMQTAAPSVAATAVRLLGATLRVRVAGFEDLQAEWRAGRSLIHVVWHGRLLMAPWMYGVLRGRGMPAVGVLASRSRDGDLVAAFARRFGMASVRGSSSRGGAAALHGLARCLRDGRDVAIVPDGPRGPRERLQPGVVALAALTGAAIVPFAFAARPARRFDTWDRFLVPAPFARCTALFGPPFRVPRESDREAARRTVEERLSAVTAEADLRVSA